VQASTYLSAQLAILVPYQLFGCLIRYLGASENWVPDSDQLILVARQLSGCPISYLVAP
jgi:hypothetical protein